MDSVVTQLEYVLEGFPQLNSISGEISVILRGKSIRTAKVMAMASFLNVHTFLTRMSCKGP